MAKIAVATTLCKDGRHWYEQQLFWLHRTADSFEHFVVAFDIDPAEFVDSHVILADAHINQERDHVLALQSIIKLFRTLDFDYYLILDSDCFPVTDGWLLRLLRIMRRKLFAAPIRYENFDTFPHPAAMLLKPAALQLELDFRPATYHNLFGRKVRDVGVSLLQQAGAWLPLPRTNSINLHPVMAGLYLDSFYHHGAGSRWPEFRGTQDEFVVENEVMLAEELTNRYFANPIGFIEQLRSVVR